MYRESRGYAALAVLYRGCLNAYELLIGSGWARSRFAMKAMDVHGEPLPWFVYPAIEWLKQSVKTDWTVCEYGCGQSTSWFAKRCRVRSVERHKEWADKTTREAGINVHQTNDMIEYATFAKASDKLVIIDGDWRMECTKHVCDILPDMVILDNSEVYAAEEKKLLMQRYAYCIPFVGMAPAAAILETSLFLCPNRQR